MKNLKTILMQLTKPLVVTLAVLALIFGASSLLGVTIAGDPPGLNGGP
jgi:hypothetical protein